MFCQMMTWILVILLYFIAYQVTTVFGGKTGDERVAFFKIEIMSGIRQLDAFHFLLEQAVTRVLQPVASAFLFMRILATGQYSA